MLVAAWASLRHGAGAATLPPALQRIVETIMPPAVAQMLIFEKLQTFFVREELIAISNQAVAVVESFETENRTVTLVPGTAWVDGAVGGMLVIGVSAVFVVDNSSLVDGIVQLGVDVPISTIQGQNNIPGRWIGGGYVSVGPGGPRVDPRRGLREMEPDEAPRWRRRKAAQAPMELQPSRRRLTAQETAELGAQHFWSDLVELLPAWLLRDNVSDWLLSHANANFTIASPQKPLNAFTTFFVPLLDIEFSVRLLALSNQNAASARIGPTLRFGGDGTVTEGFLVAPFFSTFLTQTYQQAAELASSGLSTIANWIGGNGGAAKQAALDSAQLLGDYFGTQLGPLPTALTLEFELIIRSQLSINDGDIASVF